MAKHHSVQDKYLTQWRKTGTENQLNIYFIPENKFIERGPGWKGFWREDFNILNKDGDEENFYLPEKVTAHIDSLGIDVIRKVDAEKQRELEGYARCYLSFYIALQYVRTPRHREELNKLIEAIIKKMMRADLDKPEKLKISKKDLLGAKPRNEEERKSIERALAMSDEELQKEVFEFMHGDEMRIKLTNPGHSKSILKVDKLAKKIFDVQWVFLVAPDESAFITSDNPCYTVSNTDTSMGVGILSPNAMTFFPLRPDLCVVLAPKIKSQRELFKKADKKSVREINLTTLKNSYRTIVARDMKHLEHITKGYDYKNHRASRDIAVSEFGDYVMFNIE